MAVAQFFRADRGDPLGFAGRLRRAEGFEVLGDGVFVRAGKGRDHAQQSNGKGGQHQRATIDIHRFLRVFVCWQSCRRARFVERPAKVDCECGIVA